MTVTIPVGLILSITHLVVFIAGFVAAIIVGLKVGAMQDRDDTE